MENFDPVEIEFVLNTKGIEKDAAKVKDQLKGIGDTADDVGAKVDTQLGAAFGNAGDGLEKGGKVIDKTQVRMRGLSHSINQVTREFPSFVYSMQTGFLAISNNLPILVDEIARLKQNNAELMADGQKAVPLWQQLGKALFSWQTLLSVGVSLLTIYGHKMVNFISLQFQGKKAIDEHKKSIEALNAAFESTSYTKAIEDVMAVKSAIETAKNGYTDTKEALRQYNDTLGDTLGKTEDINEAERILIAKGPAYIEAMLYRAAALSATSEAAKELAENQKKQFEVEEEIIQNQKRLDEANKKPSVNSVGGGQLVGNTAKNAAVVTSFQLDKELDELEKDAVVLQEKSGKIIDKLNQKAAEIAKAAGLDFNEKDKEPKAVTDNRKKLLQKLADLDAEYSRKQFARDEEEVQALRDKFGKVRTLVEDFNKDPKNSKVKIDLTAFSQLEEGAVSDLTYKQDTRKLEEQFKVQKQVFEDFEEYKKLFGTTKAKERYAEELKEFESYADYVKSQMEANQEAFDAVTSGTAGGGQQDRVKLIQKETDAVVRAQETQQNALLASLRGYEGERLLLIEKFNETRLKLLANGKSAEATELSRIFQEQLDEMDEANAKSMEAYKALVQGVDSLSTKAAKVVVANAQKMVDSLVKAGRLGKDGAAEIMSEINKVNDALADREQQKINDIADSFANIGFALTSAGDDITKAVGGMVIEISTALSSLSDSNQNSLQKASSLVGLIVQAGTIMNSIGEDKLNKDVNKQKELNRGVSEQLAMETKINELRRERAEMERNSSAFLDSYYKDNFVSAIKSQADSEKQLVESMKLLSEKGIFSAEGVGKRLLFGKKTEDRDFSIKQILGDFDVKGYYHNPEAWIFDPLSIFGGYSDVNVSKDALKQIRNAFNDSLTAMGKTSADVAKFSAAEWLDFMTLMESAGHVTDKATKAMLDNAKNALEVYNDAMEEMKTIISDFGGSLGSELSNSLVQAFRTGESAAEGFKTSLNNILTQLFLQDLLNSQFRTYFDSLQKEMEESMGLDGDQSWLDDVARFGDNISPALDQGMAAIAAFNEELKKMGYAGFEDPSTANNTGLQGAIRRELTEETGSELTGLFRGQFDITKRHFQLSEKHFELDQRNFEATMQIVAKTARIEENTANTVTELQYAVTELKSINKNTKPSQTERDLGL